MKNILIKQLQASTPNVSRFTVQILYLLQCQKLSLPLVYTIFSNFLTAWEALRDRTLMFLGCAAIVEMAIGTWKTVTTGDAKALFDGIAIIIGLLLFLFNSSYSRRGAS
jgi:hypothetical protein